MPERVVRLGSMVYMDSGGRPRRADCGATVDVHPDYVGRFDRLNVLMGQQPEVVEPVVSTPKPRGRPRKRADDE